MILVLHISLPPGLAHACKQLESIVKCMQHCWPHRQHSHSNTILGGACRCPGCCCCPPAPPAAAAAAARSACCSFAHARSATDTYACMGHAAAAGQGCAKG
jgi:hypothetical protein